MEKIRLKRNKRLFKMNNRMCVAYNLPICGPQIISKQAAFRRLILQLPSSYVVYRCHSRIIFTFILLYTFDAFHTCAFASSFV